MRKSESESFLCARLITRNISKPQGRFKDYYCSMIRGTINLLVNPAYFMCECHQEKQCKTIKITSEFKGEKELP